MEIKKVIAQWESEDGYKKECGFYIVAAPTMADTGDAYAAMKEMPENRVHMAMEWNTEDDDDCGVAELAAARAAGISGNFVAMAYEYARKIS